MAYTATFQDDQINARSLHMVRAICLVALIFIHCFSYSTLFFKAPLSQMNFVTVLIVLATLNSIFIFIAGVTFRLTMGGSIEGDRLKGGTSRKIFETLLFLLAIDTTKNVFMEGGVAAIFNWDFLKTIIVAFALCYFLSRINIYLNLLVVFLISWNYSPIKNFLQDFYFRPEEVPAFNAFHIQLIFISFALAIYFSYRVWSFSIKLPARFAGLLVINSLLLFCVHQITQMQTDLVQYTHARNWWLVGTIGDARHVTLMTLLAWGPSLLLGFGGTHLILSWQKKLRPLKAWSVASISAIAYAASMVYCALYLEDFYPKAFATWHYVGQNETSFTAELVKACVFLTLFASLVVLNSRRQKKWLDELALKMSLASFWVYILVTTWSPYASALSIQLFGNLMMGVIGGFVSTMVLGFLIAEFVYFMSRKQIRLKLRRVG